MCLILCIYRLAMKYHPDRFTDPDEKKTAKIKFQSISSAYSVLRDGKYHWSTVTQRAYLIFFYSKKTQTLRPDWPRVKVCVYHLQLGGCQYRTKNRINLSFFVYFFLLSCFFFFSLLCQSLCKERRQLLPRNRL
jgi:hypothetical protein